MKKHVFVIGMILCLTLLSFNSQAVQINPDTEFTVGNETYYFNTTMYFSEILVNNTWIKFNNTDFNISSTNDINISIMYLHPNPTSASNGEEVLDFYANTSGIVTFSISGLQYGTGYTIERDAVNIATATANASRCIQFTNNVWSIKHFEIYVTETTTPTTPPVIDSDFYGGYITVEIQLLDVNKNPVDIHLVDLYHNGSLIDGEVTNFDGIVRFKVLPGEYSVKTTLDEETREKTFKVIRGEENSFTLSFADSEPFQIDFGYKESLVLFCFVAILVIVLVYGYKKHSEKNRI